MKKKIVVVFIIVVFLLFVCSMATGYYDGARVSTGHEPKFVIKTYSEKTDAVTYWGLGYKVVRYVAVSPKESYESNVGVKMGSWFMKYDKPVYEDISIEITETGETMSVTRMRDIAALSDCLSNQKYFDEVCEGIVDYKIKIDDTVYAVKSACMGIHCNGKEARITREDMERILDIIERARQEELTDTSETETKQAAEPVITETDWAEYFDGINGAAVIYNPTANEYQIYNQETALARRSPCSTFKIISSLIALEKKIIVPENSTRTWSGEVFWNEEWNRDIGFEDAFRTSCVWYYRETIDEIGKDSMQEELNKLQYGNCDISDWEGRPNTNNNNRALTGFWIESSLKISPKEQVEVLERIFGEASVYAKETQDNLKTVMRMAEQPDDDIVIYGKTGMGKMQGVVVDAWFTGFADINGDRSYFCVWLGETEGKDVSSAKAREIAVKIVSESGGDL